MPTWIDAFNQMKTTMADANGVSPQGYSRVTNEQAASILRFVMKVQTENKLPAELVGQWYKLALGIAGWAKPGDKFLVTADHRREQFPDAGLPVLWTTALGVATVAQEKRIPFAMPTVSPQTDYNMVLRKAWEKMQADEKTTGVKVPAPLPAPEMPPPKKEKKLPAWALLLGAYLLSEGKGL